MTAKLKDERTGKRFRDGRAVWFIREGGQHFVSITLPHPGGASERHTFPLDRAEAAAGGRLLLDVRQEWPDPEPTPPPTDISNGVPQLEEWLVDTDPTDVPLPPSKVSG